MPLKTIKIFIASSAELKEDREGFEKFINVENNRLNNLGFRIEIVQWEYFNDAVSVTRLQDEYNKALLQCDIALCLFFTKAGKYTEEEFDTAYRLFKEKGKPKIYTYFKDASVSMRSLTEEVNSLFHFRTKINALGHFPTYYSNIQDLMYQFKRQLEIYIDANMPARIPVIEGAMSERNDSNNTTLDKTPVDYIFNDQLTKRLIKALSAYSPDAKKIVNTRDWQTEPRLMDKAKASIAAAFVGVLGLQLRKLFAIGKEGHSEEKSKNYLENRKVISRRGLQFLCFTLISKLWDYKKENTHINISDDQTASLKDFFECIRSIDSKTFIHLLKDLIGIFSENNLEFPIAELTGFKENLDEGSSFVMACNILAAAHDCMEAETQLTLFLEKLNFLAAYRMVSMKSIGYFEMLNSNPYYLYNFTALGLIVSLM